MGKKKPDSAGERGAKKPPKTRQGFELAFVVPPKKLTAKTRQKLKPSIDEIKKILEVEDDKAFGRYTAFNALEVD
jgi:hypothetical protein